MMDAKVLFVFTLCIMAVCGVPIGEDEDGQILVRVARSPHFGWFPSYHYYPRHYNYYPGGYSYSNARSHAATIGFGPFYASLASSSARAGSGYGFHG